MDETNLKVQGRWVYLYRAIDRSGDLVDVMLSETRDMKAARHSSVRPRPSPASRQEKSPQTAMTATRAIGRELGRRVKHRTSRYLTNRLEQDHRGIKGRYRPMRGFKCVQLAARFYRGYNERGTTAAKFSVSTLMFDYVLTGVPSALAPPSMIALAADAEGQWLRSLQNADHRCCGAEDVEAAVVAETGW